MREEVKRDPETELMSRQAQEKKKDHRCVVVCVGGCEREIERERE